MKKFVVLFIFLVCSSCAQKSSPLNAIYLTHGQGELSSEELRAHPEVMVVGTFEELKKNSNPKIALWIDKNATPFDAEQEEWINAAPQAHNPLVLVGTSDTLHAYRDLLRIEGFQGPAGNYRGRDAPGFSVIQRKPVDANVAAINLSFMHGYDQKPTVQSILEITNALLEGKIRPTPMSTLLQAPTEIATSTIHPIILYDQTPGSVLYNDAAKINWVSLDGNILTIDVAYEGNCQPHTFELYTWTPFLQSNPPQAAIFLSHDAHGDTCTDQLEQELSFDLTPLEKERNDPSEHPLLLRITEPIGGSFATEPAGPLIEWP